MWLPVLLDVLDLVDPTLQREQQGLSLVVGLDPSGQAGLVESHRILRGRPRHGRR